MTNLGSVRVSQRTGVALVLLATLVLLSSQRSAQADQLTIVTPSIKLKANVNGSTQTAFAGNAAGQVNGGAVPWVFSLTYSSNAYAPGTYNTSISNNGKIDGQAVHNAGQVAWLVTTYGASTVGNAKLGAVLQAAIWTVIYGNNFDLKSFQVPGDPFGLSNIEMIPQYTTYVAMAQTVGALAALLNPGLVGSVSWLSTTGATGGSAGGFVTVGSVPSSAPPAIGTPEPTTLLISGVGIVAMMLIHRRGKFRLDRETSEDVDSPALASA